MAEGLGKRAPQHEGKQDTSCQGKAEIEEHIRKIEEINGEPVVYMAHPKATVDEKRPRDIDDDGGRDNRKRPYFPSSPPKILKRREEFEHHLDNPQEQDNNNDGKQDKGNKDDKM